MTTLALATRTHRTPQHINRVCRLLFRTPGGWRRDISPEEAERVVRWFQRPGCKGCGREGCSQPVPAGE